VKSLAALLLAVTMPASAWAQAAPAEVAGPGERSPEADIEVVPPEPYDPAAPWVVRERRRPIRPPPRPVWFLRIDGGPLFERIYDQSICGGQLTVVALREVGPVALTMGASATLGSLQPELFVARAGFAFGLEIPISIVRFGASFGVGAINIASVTEDGSITAATLDVTAQVSVDVARLSDDGTAAFYVGAKFLGTMVVASDADPLVWGPAALAGFRL
jgi:hypothetical protein